MKGDRYCCKVCKCIWDTSGERKDPSRCPECGSPEIVNLTAAQRREAQRADESARNEEKRRKEKLMKQEKMLIFKHRAKKQRYSRGRF